MEPTADEGGHEHSGGVRNAGGCAPATAARARNLERPAGERQAAPRRQRLLAWARVAVGVTILGVILSRVDIRTATVPVSARLAAAVVTAAVLLLASQAVASRRWHLILGDDRLPWRYLFRLYVIGTFFGLFLPGSVGGDAVRAAAAARSSTSSGRTLASVLLDRGLGFAATVAYLALGAILLPGVLRLLRDDQLHWRTPSLPAVAIVAAAAGAAALLLGRSRRVRSVWREGAAAAAELARSPRRLAYASALSLLSQGLLVLLWSVLARGMHLDLPAVFLIWAVPVVTLSALLPVTFSGLGLREGAWLLLLAGSGIPRADIVAFSLLYFVCNVLVGVLGGLLFVATGTAPPRSELTCPQPSR